MYSWNSRSSFQFSGPNNVIKTYLLAILLISFNVSLIGIILFNDLDATTTS